ncbi:hypothetical protein EVAR_65739_1 [Eumeta japonica]|uniref:Uncharacterized protein n=1 Tax=Eumeta variegata TaxID=151549 RepID=A0A4C1ZSP4_EUMVA|nr:hypothetical protein EVAR_65739_1 [Eumeta japonica]
MDSARVSCERTTDFDRSREIFYLSTGFRLRLRPRGHRVDSITLFIDRCVLNHDPDQKRIRPSSQWRSHRRLNQDWFLFDYNCKTKIQPRRELMTFLGYALNRYHLLDSDAGSALKMLIYLKSIPNLNLRRFRLWPRAFNPGLAFNSGLIISILLSVTVPIWMKPAQMLVSN